MAKADVELAVRARDEASGALKAINKTVKELTSEQKDLVAATQVSSKSLNDQTKALASVNKELTKSEGKLAGLEEELRQEASAAEQLADAFTGMSSALDKATRDFNDASAPAQKLSAEMKALTDRSKLLRDENRNLSISSADIKKSIDEARVAVKPFSEAVKSAKDELKLAAKEFGASNRELSKAGTEVKQADAAFKKLEDRAASLGEKLGKSKAKLAELNTALADAASKKNSDGTFANAADKAAYEQLAAAVTRTTTAIAANETKLGTVNTKLGVAAQRIKEASTAYDAAAANVTKAQEAFNKQQTNLANAKVAAEQAAAGISKLNEELAENQRRSRENSAEIAKLTSERQALNAKWEEATVLQRQANAALKEAEKNANSAANALEKQKAKVAQLGTQTAAVRGETTSLASKQQDLGASVDKTTKELSQQTAALKHLESEQSKANKGLSLFNDTGRTTLSFAQRIRGQILSLTAAYVGLYGAVSLVQRGLALQQQEAGTAARLNVVFDGDAGKAAEELKLLRSEANRLGITYQDLAEQYSKVAVAATSSGATIEQTRTVFFGLAETSRALGLSSEQNERIFTAINQIFSKTKISAEELRQQLGDSLPGATAVLAKSLGVTTKELDKMLQAGTVSSQELIKFVDELQKQYGKGLAGQVNSVTAELERTKTVINDVQKAFNSGFFVGFGKALKDIRDGLGGNDGVNRLAQQTGLVLGQLVNGAIAFIKALNTLTPLIVGFGAAWAAARLGAVVSSITEINGGLGLMTTMLKASWTELATFKTNLFATERVASRTALTFRALGAALNLLSGALAAGAIGYEFGKLLLNFKWAQKFGVELVGVLLRLQAVYAGLGRIISSAIMLVRDDYSAKDFTADLKLIDKEVSAELKNISKTVNEQVADINSGLTDLANTSAGGAGDSDFTKFLEEQKKLALAQADVARAEQAASDAREKAAKAREKADEKAAKAAETLAARLVTYDSLLESSRDKVEDLGRAYEAFDDKRQAAMRDGSAATLDSRLKDAEAKVNVFKRESDALSSDIEKQISKLQTIIDAKDSTPEQKQKAFGQQVELGTLMQSLDSARDADAQLLRDRLGNLARLDQAQADYAEFEAARQREIAENQRLFDQGQIDANDLQLRNNATIEQTGVLMASAADEAARYAELVGNPELARQLEAQGLAAQDGIVLAMVTANDVSSILFSNISTGIEAVTDGFAQVIAGTQSWGEALGNLGDIFRNFAAGVLRDLANMILKYMIFNAISGALSSISPGFSQYINSSVLGIKAHTGAVVGTSSYGGKSMAVNPTWFAGAQRFHTGGLPGLKRDEVPAILQTGEEVLSRNDPRNVMNGGGGSSKPQDIKIVNTIDSGSVISQGIATREGEKAIMNFMRANRGSLKQVLA